VLTRRTEDFQSNNPERGCKNPPWDTEGICAATRSSKLATPPVCEESLEKIRLVTGARGDIFKYQQTQPVNTADGDHPQSDSPPVSGLTVAWASREPIP